MEQNLDKKTVLTNEEEQDKNSSESFINVFNNQKYRSIGLYNPGENPTTECLCETNKKNIYGVDVVIVNTS